MTKEILCPNEVAQTRRIAQSGHYDAVQLRVESGAEYCEGFPDCTGPVVIEVERNRVAAVFLGKFTTEEVCPKVYGTIQR